MFKKIQALQQAARTVASPITHARNLITSAFKPKPKKPKIGGTKKSDQIKKSNIRFEDVSFQYKAGKERAIKNININIEGEKITALVGHSGAGKSTIMNLIPRFYQPQNGDILID